MPRLPHPRFARGFAWSPARVALTVGLCERTECEDGEALSLIEEHPGIAV
jgi:hypothetical protein